MEVNDNEYISDSAQTDGTASTETSKRKKRRVLIEDKTDIWLYFNKLDPPKPKHKKGSCNVEIKTSKDVKIYEHIINTDENLKKLFLLIILSVKFWEKFLEKFPTFSLSLTFIHILYSRIKRRRFPGGWYWRPASLTLKSLIVPV